MITTKFLVYEFGVKYCQIIVSISMYWDNTQILIMKILGFFWYFFKEVTNFCIFTLNHVKFIWIEYLFQ